jgi:hypothetical protein
LLLQMDDSACHEPVRPLPHHPLVHTSEMLDLRPHDETRSEADPSAAATAATAAAKKISARIATSEVTDVCVVCLQPCNSKACACSFMHSECAEKYSEAFGGACKVCAAKFDATRLSKRRIDDDEAELERVARKRARERATAESAANIEWARLIAPCAAHIIATSFAQEEGGRREAPVALCFGSVVLSLVYAGEQYLEDLSERLGGTQPPSVVAAAVHRLRGASLLQAPTANPPRPAAGGRTRD